MIVTDHIHWILSYRMHWGEYWFCVEFLLVDFKLNRIKYTYKHEHILEWQNSVYIGTLHATFTFIFLGHAIVWVCIQNHPIYFCCENLHIASFDQMFNQNIWNGSSNKITTFYSHSIDRKSGIWVRFLCILLEKKVHHITGRKVIYYFKSFPFTCTIHTPHPHSYRHYAICRKVKGKKKEM